jgi:hypothetical protein
MRQYLAATVLATAAFGVTASAESTADLVVDSGSTVSVELAVEISTSFGTDTDADSVTKTIEGVGIAVVGADAPPFLSLALPSLSFDLGAADFNYQFFCLPIIGCQNMDVSVSNFVIGLDAGGVSGPVKGGNAAYPAAPFVSSFDYSVSGLADITGSNVVPDVYSFGTGVAASGDNLVLSNMYLDSITFEIDPVDLPAGVNSVVITANVDLSGTTMSGLLVSSGSPADFNGDGQVNGADLGLLLASWGPCKGCPEDLNGDGQVNGADLGLMLADWG